MESGTFSETFLKKSVDKKWFCVKFYWQYEGKYDLAIADLDEAIKLDPENSDAYDYRGNVRIFRGEYELATEGYDKAAKLERDCSK